MPALISQTVAPSSSFAISGGSVAFGNESADPVGAWTEPGPHATNRIITNDQTLTINAAWTASGFMHTLLVGAAKWKCSIYLEAMGATEASPGTYSAPLIPFVSSGTYAVPITIPAGLPAGLYRVVFTMTVVHNTAGNLPLGGFADLDFFQVMDDM